MIIGIGNDLVENRRFIEKLEEGKETFFSRLFTQGEIDYCEKYRTIESQAEHYAARFAAKEALVKAMGTGFREMTFHEMEVKNNSLGAPYFVVSGRVKESLDQMNGKRIHLTLSHTVQHSLATVVIEGEEG